MSAGHHLKKWLSKRTYLLCGFIGPLITPLKIEQPARSDMGKDPSVGA